jgi:tetratricopeptide (TPR) repeat protein
MKKCPYCQKGNNDDEIQCWNCGEWFETVSPSRQNTVVKPPKIEQSGTDSIDWQTKLGGIFNEYRIPIISIIVMAGLLFTISQIANFNKSAEQVAGIKSPKVDAPAAPAPEPAPAPEHAPVSEHAPAPSSAIDLYNNALSLCEGSKCTDSQKAIEYLNEAIRLQPDFANAYGARGNAYGNQRQYQLSLEDYDKAILLKPDKVAFFNNRGNVYKDLNKYQLAIEDYNEAIRLKPDNAEAYHNRGNAYFIQGNKSLGCSDAQKACELGNCQLLEWAKDKKYCR